VAAVALALSTGVVALLEGPPLSIADASPVYLVAVVAVGARFGTLAALVTALAAFLVYDLLFTEPRFAVIVSDTREWLDLVLFLFVAMVTGRLAALGHERADQAERRERESRALFAVSRLLATSTDLDELAPAVADRLARETGMERVWISLAGGRERILADSGDGARVPSSPVVTTLVRTAGDQPPRWVRAHEPLTARDGERQAWSDSQILRVRVDAEGDTLGWVWASRARAAGLPPPETTRLLALAADQVGMALRREQLRREATDAEIARQGDALKSALVDSVSHDLRTPLASIRAAAGSLLDPAVDWSPDERRAAAGAIDAEAERLDRLVSGVLDLSRIEAGALHPDLEPHDVRQLVEPAVARARPLLGDREVEVSLPADLPPIMADGLFVDQVLGNLLENAARYAPPPARVGLSASTGGDGRVAIVVEDGGPGVPPEALPRLFDKFYRVQRPGEGARRGMGIGLAIVRGLAEAMGATIEAGPSELGGLAIRLGFPAAPVPPAEGPG
jgi:two-component system sensor histidine kinase KdpD